MRLKVALVLGVFTMAAVLLSGGHNRAIFGARDALATGSPSACMEILGCLPGKSSPQSFILKVFNDGCGVGLALDDDCATDVTNIVTSQKGCTFVLGTSGEIGVNYSIL